MKKLFFFFAAMLVAITMSAQIPSTDFSSPYFLSGDAAVVNDYFTLNANNCLVSKNPESATENYGIATWQFHSTANVAVNVTLNISAESLYGHTYCVEIYNSCNAKIATFNEGGWYDVTGDKTFNGYVYLGVDDYTVKLLNTCNGSVATICGVTLTYSSAIPVTTIPNTLIPDDALLSSRAWVDKTGAVDSILFTPRGSEGYNLDEWVKWIVYVPSEGYYNFTANTYRKSSQKFEITLLDGNECNVLISNDNGGKNIGSGNASISTGTVNLSPGNYVVKVRNIYQYADSRLLNVVVTYAGGAVINIPANSLPANEGLLFAETGGTLKMYKLANGDIKYNDNGYPTTEYAIWNVNATAGRYKVTTHTTSGGHTFTVALYSDLSQAAISSVEEDVATKWDANATLPGTLDIPVAGNYYIKVVNSVAHSGETLQSISFAVAPIPVVKFKGDFGDNWADHVATSTDNGISASVTIPLGVFTEKEFGLTIGDDFRANGYGYHRGYTGTAGITGNDGNMKLTTDYIGNYVFTWYFLTDAMEITFPEKTLVDGFYLIKPDWSISALAGKFEEMENSSPKQWKLSTTLAAGDQIKVVYVENGGIKEWMPNGENTQYTVDAEHAGNVIIYTKGNDYQSEWSEFGGYFYVAKDNSGQTTSLAGVQADEAKARKLMQNGQLIIIKDGVMYNVLGTQIK